VHVGGLQRAPRSFPPEPRLRDCRLIESRIGVNRAILWGIPAPPGLARALVCILKKKAPASSGVFVDVFDLQYSQTIPDKTKQAVPGY
jgi:hypothetical protein